MSINYQFIIMLIASLLIIHVPKSLSVPKSRPSKSWAMHKNKKLKTNTKITRLAHQTSVINSVITANASHNPWFTIYYKHFVLIPIRRLKAWMLFQPSKSDIHTLFTWK